METIEISPSKVTENSFNHIPFQESLREAFDILNQVYSKRPKTFKQNTYVATYCNGREYGFKITAGLKSVCFAQDRHTDEIVVYIGDIGEFACAGNIPSDDIYLNKKLFAYNEKEKAAQFIINFCEKSLLNLTKK